MSNLEFNLITTDEELHRPIISNTTELFTAVQAMTADYKTAVYTVDKEAEAKDDRARLNKLKTALNDAKKRVKKESDIPYNKFAGEIDRIIAEVDEAITNIDQQTAEMERIRREENLNKAHECYLMVIDAAGLAEWLPWEKVLASRKTTRVTYEDYFGNKGTWKDNEDLTVAGANVIATLQDFVDMVNRKIKNIQDFEFPSEFTQKALEYMKNTYDPIHKSLDYDGAVALMKDLKRREDEKQAAIEEARRQAEIERQRAIEEERRRAEAEKQRALEEANRKAEEEKRAAVEKAQQEALRKAAEEALRNAPPDPVKDDIQADIDKKIAEAGFDPFAAPKQEFNPMKEIATETILDDPFSENPQPVQVAVEEPAAEVSREWVAFKAYLSEEEAIELANFFADRNIQFGPA